MENSWEPQEEEYETTPRPPLFIVSRIVNIIFVLSYITIIVALSIIQPPILTVIFSIAALIVLLVIHSCIAHIISTIRDIASNQDECLNIIEKQNADLQNQITNLQNQIDKLKKAGD